MCYCVELLGFLDDIQFVLFFSLDCFDGDQLGHV